MRGYHKCPHCNGEVGEKTMGQMKNHLLDLVGHPGRRSSYPGPVNKTELEIIYHGHRRIDKRLNEARTLLENIVRDRLPPNDALTDEVKDFLEKVVEEEIKIPEEEPEFDSSNHMGERSL